MRQHPSPRIGLPPLLSTFSCLGAFLMSACGAPGPVAGARPIDAARARARATLLGDRTARLRALASADGLAADVGGARAQPAATQGACPEVPLAALARDGDAVEVAVLDDDWVVATWMPRARLATVVTRTSALRSDPAAPARGALHAGARVEVRERRGETVAVEHLSLAGRAWGWVASSDVDTVYVDAPAAASSEPAAAAGSAPKAEVWLASPARVEPREDAAVVFETTFTPARELGREGGWAHVELDAGSITAQGFVDVGALRSTPPVTGCESPASGHASFASSCDGPRCWSGQVTVPAGTCARTEDGALVGVARRAVEVSLVVTGTDATPRWGQLHARAEPWRVEVRAAPGGGYQLAGDGCGP
jgi:hypothetical protein